MEFRELLVVIPHCGILVPGEIPVDSLSPDFPRQMRNVDWYTHWLYDFRDLLDNAQVTFPYCSLILEANRHPQNLEDWQADYDDGHYAIVIGIQGPIVVFEDPASARRTWLKEEEFLARWHDRDPKTKRRLEQFAMVLMGKPPVRRTPVHMD